MVELFSVEGVSDDGALLVRSSKGRETLFCRRRDAEEAITDSFRAIIPVRHRVSSRAPSNQRPMWLLIDIGKQFIQSRTL